MKEINCPFLYISKTESHNSNDSTEMLIMKSQYLGTYRISVEAASWINTYKVGQKFTIRNLTQGLVNCAYRILTANALDSYPFIVGPLEYNSFKSNLDSISRTQERPIQLLNIEDVVNERVDHTQKANAILLRFADRLNDQQAFSKFTPSIQDMVVAKIAGIDELIEILKYLLHEEYITGSLLNGFMAGYEPEAEAPFNDSYSFSMKGWKQIQVEKDKINTNKVFIATSFSWPRDNSLRNEVLEAIKRACKQLGWEADIVSQSHTDYITDRILSEIRSSRFVIAELTYHNRGVYFESGFARGLGKNVFHIVKEGFNLTSPDADKDAKRIHFDIQQVQYRTWSTPDEAYEKLYDWINSTFGPYKL